jgi:hypothetical protein
MFYTIAAFLVSMLVAGLGAANADALTVSSGFYHMRFADPTVMRFSGDDFDISALYSPVPGIGPFETCFTCEPGTMIDLSSRISGVLGIHGIARLPGAEYSNVSFSGDLRFDAPTLTAPAVLPPLFETARLRAPFLFSGQLTAFSTPELTGPALFALALTGGGDVQFVIDASSSHFQFFDLDYRFTSASVAPTPEPATLVLVAGGLLSIPAMRRRRQRQARYARCLTCLRKQHDAPAVVTGVASPRAATSRSYRFQAGPMK